MVEGDRGRALRLQTANPIVTLNGQPVSGAVYDVAHGVLRVEVMLFWASVARNPQRFGENRKVIIMVWATVAQMPRS